MPPGFHVVEFADPEFWVAVGKIIWINVLLSGDNAVVIALACRLLPPRERRIIMLRFFANMTQSQIGEEVGISQMHVSRLIRRALEQVRLAAGQTG